MLVTLPEKPSIGPDFMETISEYIDFSENEELWKEVSPMMSLGQCIYADGVEEGVQEGIKEGIRVLVLDGIEEQIPKERSLNKLQRHFHLTREAAEQYYEQYANEASVRL